jgi:hypothetical protein
MNACPRRSRQVEVSHIAEVTERARRFGAGVLLAPREGPAGWRSVVAVAQGGALAFWQSKTPAAHSSDLGLR